MTSSSKQDRQRAVTQTLASWAIEGFQPDAEYLVLLDQYINGEVTIEQVSAATDTKFSAMMSVNRNRNP